MTAAALLLLAAAPVHGQWHAEARIGRLDFRLDPAAVPASTSLAVGLGRDHADGWLRLSAGVPMGAEDPLWGAAEIAHGFATRTGALTLGVDFAGQGFLQRYSRQLQHPGGLFEPPRVVEGHETGYGIAAQVVPAAELRLGRLSLQARAGRSWYRTALGEQQATRNATVAEVQLALAPTASSLLAAEGRQYWAADQVYQYVGLSGAHTFAALRLWGSVGQWVTPEEHAVPWTAGLAVPFAHRFELRLHARADAVDPLYGGVPRRSWTAGLRVTLGDVARSRPPVPAAYRAGRATVELAASGTSGTPRIAGDFNGWTPEPMTRRGEAWVFVVDLAPGVYEYAFVDENGRWFVPASVPGRRDDGMGGHVALLVVGGAS